MRPVYAAIVGILLSLAVTISAASQRPEETRDASYLSWSAKQAEAIGEQAFRRGRVGGFFDTRLLKTERSYNYKLAATWLTPDVIRATARLAQLRSRLSDEQTRVLVREAEAAADIVVLVEIDPREGSGVIPLDWEAFLQPKGRPDEAIRGQNAPELRRVKALGGVLSRNYDYDRFWMKFDVPATNGSFVADGDSEVELVVRIYEKEGRVTWPIPSSARRVFSSGFVSTPGR